MIAISHPTRVWSSLQGVNLLEIAAGLLLNAPIVLLRTMRASVVVSELGYRVPFGDQLRIQLIGTTSSSLTPAASGDYVRAYMWRRRHAAPLRAGAAVVTFERLYSLGLMIALGLLLIALPRHGAIGWIGVGLGLAAAAVSPLLLEQVPPGLERWILNRVALGPLRRFTTGALDVVDNLRRLMRSPSLLAASSSLTLTIFFLSGVQVWLVLNALDHTVPMTQAVATYSTSQAVGILSTLPFGIGTTDAVVVGLLAGYGVTLSLAATVAVLLRAMATLPQALAGLVASVTLDTFGAPPGASVDAAVELVSIGSAD